MENTVGPAAARPADGPSGATLKTSDAAGLKVEVLAAVEGLSNLEDAPLTEHIESYQHIYSGLQHALSDIEGV